MPSRLERFTPTPPPSDLTAFEVAEGERINLADGQLHVVPAERAEGASLRKMLRRYCEPRGLFFVAQTIQEWNSKTYGYEVGVAPSAEEREELAAKLQYADRLKYDLRAYPADGYDENHVPRGGELLNLCDGTAWQLRRGTDYREATQTFRTWVKRYADREGLALRDYVLRDDGQDVGVELALAASESDLPPKRNSPIVHLDDLGAPRDDVAPEADEGDESEPLEDEPLEHAEDGSEDQAAA